MATCRTVLYFSSLFVLCAAAVVLNGFNIDWHNTTSARDITKAIIILILINVLYFAIADNILRALVTLFIGRRDVDLPDANGSNLTVVINYNLLAINLEDVDNALHSMYETFLLNLGTNVSAVLVSETRLETIRSYEIHKLEEYRNKIYGTIYKEGKEFVRGRFSNVNEYRLKYLWYKLCDKFNYEFVDVNLDEICKHYTNEFMVIHRVSSILKKCGQYQDMILLSEGEDQAYSYTDQRIYGNRARRHGENLFLDSENVRNILGRQFDYTFILDNGTEVPEGTVQKLLNLASLHPTRVIIQPAIVHKPLANSSLFMHRLHLRNELKLVMNSAISRVLDSTRFVGNALINNQLYVDKIIGNPVDVLEMIPPDVLSHDTYETVILNPLYANNVTLYRSPTRNLMTWNSRDQRHTTGEVINATYMWNHSFGIFVRILRAICRREWWGTSLAKTPLRAHSGTSFYIAANPGIKRLRKPVFLFYIILHYAFNTAMHYPQVPLYIILITYIVLVKLPCFTRANLMLLPIEVLCSLLELTPDAFLGTVKLTKGLHACVKGFPSWKPQHVIEKLHENLPISKILCKSVMTFGLYSLIAVILIAIGIIVSIFTIQKVHPVLYAMLTTVVLLPLYAFVTSLPIRDQENKDNNVTNPERLQSVFTIDTVVRRHLDSLPLGESSLVSHPVANGNVAQTADDDPDDRCYDNLAFESSGDKKECVILHDNHIARENYAWPTYQNAMPNISEYKRSKVKRTYSDGILVKDLTASQTESGSELRHGYGLSDGDVYSLNFINDNGGESYP